MKAQEIMTKNPACVTPHDSAQHAAELMGQHDCGCVPVVDERNSNRVVGVVTDRDIAVRAVAKGKAPNTPVSEIMTANAVCCPPDADVRDVERKMSDRQIRRVVIADADGCCVGIVAQADLARAARRSGASLEREVAQVVERISEPA